VEAAFERAVGLVGSLDAVVLNAGIFEADEDDRVAPRPETVRAQFEVNAMGVLHGLEACGSAIRDGGSVTITATGALWWAFPGYMGYTASKAPVLQLCRHAAMRLGPRGIRVNTVSPGTIVTEMQPDDDEEARITPVATCLGRLGTPEEVAGAFVYLASDDASYVTATDLRVDGGWIEGITPASAAILGRA